MRKLIPNLIPERSYGKGENLLVIENGPVISCPHCGESYLTAETLHEIERIKLHRTGRSCARSIWTASAGSCRNKIAVPVAECS